MINKTLVLNTIQKEVRNKGVLVLFVFTVIFLYFGHRLAISVKEFVDESSLNTFISNSSQNVIIKFISICSNFVAITLSSTIFRSDIVSKIMPQILTFPISRFSYLLSRITGAWLLTMAYFIFSLILGVVILLTSNSIEINFFSIFNSFIYMSLQLLGLIFIASFISFYSNKIFTFILAFVYFAISKTSFHFLTFGEGMLSELTVGKVINLFVYYCMPRIGELSYIAEQYIAGKAFEMSQIASALGHFAVVMTIWMIILKVIFEKKEV